MRAALPTGDDRIGWLVDRAAITDLILDFARCVDDGDSEGYAANFTEDATLVLPFATVSGRESIRAMPGPPPTWATQHLIANLLIDLRGDVAHTRAWMMATHVFDRRLLSDNAHAGGWYTHTVERTSDGWRFSRVELHIVWEGDRPMVPADASLA